MKLTWTTEKRKLGDLVKWEHNPRQLTKEQAERLQHSIADFGYSQLYEIEPDGTIIDGHQRDEIMLRMNEYGKDAEIEVRVASRQLTLDERKEYIALKHKGAVGEWDWDAMHNLYSFDELEDWGFDADELMKHGFIEEEPLEDSEEQSRKTLAERFVVPPFSVLNARAGYWQKRKKAWIDLGIDSEVGRAGTASTSAQRGDGKERTLGAIPGNQETKLSPDYEKSKAYKSQGRLSALQKGDNGLLGFSQQARSHYSAKVFGTEGSEYSEQTGTSIFDPVLCECAYTWFTTIGGSVLDPFAGGSVRGIVAEYLGREYTGIELRQEQVEANIPQAEALGLSPRWILGDSIKAKELAPGEYDFIFSCPPYYNLEVYSDLEGELSAFTTYNDFIAQYRIIISNCIDLLKDNRFACFVVGDIRDKNGIYRNFVSDTISAFQDSGAMLYNEAILVTAVGSLPIRVASQFPKGRKLGKTHQNILVFVKGDPRKAAENCGDIDIDINRLMDITGGEPVLLDT